MKPVTYDFDVITDTPAPKSRPPEITAEPAEKPPQADAERRRARPPEQDVRGKVQAAE